MGDASFMGFVWTLSNISAYYAGALCTELQQFYPLDCNREENLLPPALVDTSLGGSSSITAAMRSVGLASLTRRQGARPSRCMGFTNCIADDRSQAGKQDSGVVMDRAVKATTVGIRGNQQNTWFTSKVRPTRALSLLKNNLWRLSI